MPLHLKATREAISPRFAAFKWTRITITKRPALRCWRRSLKCRWRDSCTLKAAVNVCVFYIHSKPQSEFREDDHHLLLYFTLCYAPALMDRLADHLRNTNERRGSSRSRAFSFIDHFFCQRRRRKSASNEFITQQRGYKLNVLFFLKNIIMWDDANILISNSQKRKGSKAAGCKIKESCLFHGHSPVHTHTHTLRLLPCLFGRAKVSRSAYDGHANFNSERRF